MAQTIHEEPAIADKLWVLQHGSRPHSGQDIDYAARDLVLEKAASTGLHYLGFCAAGGGVHDGGDLPFGETNQWSFTQKYFQEHGALGNWITDSFKFNHKKYGDVLDWSDGVTFLYFLRGDYTKPESEHWGGKLTQMSDNYYSDNNKSYVSVYMENFLTYLTRCADRAREPNPDNVVHLHSGSVSWKRGESGQVSAKTGVTRLPVSGHSSGRVFDLQGRTGKMITTASGRAAAVFVHGVSRR